MTVQLIEGKDLNDWNCLTPDIQNLDHIGLKWQNPMWNERPDKI